MCSSPGPIFFRASHWEEEKLSSVVRILMAYVVPFGRLCGCQTGWWTGRWMREARSYGLHQGMEG